jgi:hypothetical protein
MFSFIVSLNVWLIAPKQKQVDRGQLVFDGFSESLVLLLTPFDARWW